MYSESQIWSDAISNPMTKAKALESYKEQIITQIGKYEIILNSFYVHPTLWDVWYSVKQSNIHRNVNMCNTKDLWVKIYGSKLWFDALSNEHTKYKAFDSYTHKLIKVGEHRVILNSFYVHPTLWDVWYSCHPMNTYGRFKH